MKADKEIYSQVYHKQTIYKKLTNNILMMFSIIR